MRTKWPMKGAQLALTDTLSIVKGRELTKDVMQVARRLTLDWTRRGC